MPDDTFYMMAGDTRPKVEFFLEKENGEPVNLTGATVIAHLRVKPGGTVKFEDRSVGVVDVDTGECSLTLTASDSGTADDYEFQCQVAFSDGGIMRVPNDGYLPFKIGDAVS